MSATMTPTPPIRPPEPVDMDVRSLPSSPPKYETVDPKGAIVDADSRSSSLSEIEDNGGTERLKPTLPGEGSDTGDTEAETERLEDSPHKTRTQQNVVLSGSTMEQHNGSSANSGSVVLTTEPNLAMLQTSDISSLDDSSEESTTSPSRKRKRSTPSRVQALVDTGARAEAASASRSVTPGEDLLEGRVTDELEHDAEESVVSELDENEVTPATLALKPLPRGKRKAKKIKSNERQPSEGPVSNIGIFLEASEPQDSNDDDMEMEDIADGAGMDATTRTEETSAKKKNALEALGAIEKCFASLKEKLYDERIARCDADLAMLESSTPTHPELLAALEVIDRHRDKKIRYEDTLIKHKLEALQRKSVAEKAQAHSQHMLEVQDIREKHLERLNKRSYQIQRERRSADTSTPDYMYHYNPKRSEQIKRQMAYNKEVSILSGVAKHVGFPAAPDLKPLKQSEVDDDLKAMGITLHPQQAQATMPRPTLPASSALSRQKSTADEWFLEQNPWANAQHPAHSQLQRQRSALSRPESPLVTPTPQKRVIDLTVLQDSASTIPENPSSSMTVTPATAEQQSKSSRMNGRVASNSHLIDMLAKAPDMRSDNRSSPHALTRNELPKEQPSNHIVSQEPARTKTHTKSHTHHANMSNNTTYLETIPNPKDNRTATPPSFATVKAEDTIQGLHQSPLLHHYPTPAPVSGGANGQVHQLGV